MSAPRRVTPPSNPAAPVSRTPIASLPWNLSEFKNPVARGGPGLFGFDLGCSGPELTALREEMQEQHVRAVADARRAAFEEGRVAGRVEAQLSADRSVVHAVDAVSQAAEILYGEGCRRVAMAEFQPRLGMAPNPILVPVRPARAPRSSSRGSA